MAVALDDEAARQEWLTAVEQLRGRRDAAAGQLSDARLQLSHLEDHAQRLARRLRQLQAAAADLQQAAATDEQKRLRQQEELQMLIAHIRAVETELAEVGQAQARAANSYAIIPYQGPNETRRRPIYVECRAEGIVLQPEDVILTTDDFDQPIGPGNPLAAALRVAREHLSRTSLAVGEEPYPLLLVRPDGMVSYYVARAALASWGSEFGYELVDTDWELDFEDPDPQLARAQREAIAAARRRQQVLASLPDRGALRADRPVYRAARDKGGAVLESSGLQFGGSNRSPGSNPKDATAGLPSSADRLPGFTAGQSNSDTHGLTSEGQIGIERGGGDRTFGNQFEQGRESDRIESSGDDFNRNDDGRYAQGSANYDALRREASSGNSPALSGGAQSNSAAAGSPGQGGDGQSIADARGDDWGLQGRVPGSVGVARSIRLVCDAERITVLSTVPYRLPNQQIAWAARTADSLDELMSAVWQNVEHWGSAGRGLHWRPELIVEVAPDAAGRFADLQSLLSRSGLTVRRQGDPVANVR
jgi:hypothetical protein